MNKRQAIIWTNDGLIYWNICITQPQRVCGSEGEVAAYMKHIPVSTVKFLI